MGLQSHWIIRPQTDKSWRPPVRPQPLRPTHRIGHQSSPQAQQRRDQHLPFWGKFWYDLKKVVMEAVTIMLIWSDPLQWICLLFNPIPLQLIFSSFEANLVVNINFHFIKCSTIEQSNTRGCQSSGWGPPFQQHGSSASAWRASSTRLGDEVRSVRTSVLCWSQHKKHDLGTTSTTGKLLKPLFR